MEHTRQAFVASRGEIHGSLVPCHCISYVSQVTRVLEAIQGRAAKLVEQFAEPWMAVRGETDCSVIRFNCAGNIGKTSLLMLKKKSESVSQVMEPVGEVRMVCRSEVHSPL